MASKTFLILAVFASAISVILSLPQRLQVLPVQPQEPVDDNSNLSPVNPAAGQLIADNLPGLQPRAFGSLFNLSAYLANAPTNSAALNFIPLITILSALG